MGKWFAILSGTALVLFTFRQVFQDLFHPAESGSISEFVARNTFNCFRRRKSLMKDAGPLSVVMVIFIWAFLTCLGFALIYLGFPDEAFQFQGKGPQKGFWTMIYFSFEMMTTLGLGDFTPSTTALRIVATLEALTGF